MSEGLLKGKVALVTGGNAGIGRATALKFAAAGAKVTIAARRESEGEAVVGEIENAGGEALFFQTDVSSAVDVERMVRTTVDRFGGLDVAFNNAGILGSKFVPTAEMEEAVWDQVIAVNLKGVWLCSEQASFVTGGALPIDGGLLI